MLHFKELYKNVKNERNKYVNLIQNLNHEKAERKQKIKTLENELDILKKNVHDKGMLNTLPIMQIFTSHKSIYSVYGLMFLAFRILYILK